MINLAKRVHFIVLSSFFSHIVMPVSLIFCSSFFFKAQSPGLTLINKQTIKQIHNINA